MRSKCFLTTEEILQVHRTINHQHSSHCQISLASSKSILNLLQSIHSGAIHLINKSKLINDFLFLSHRWHPLFLPILQGLLFQKKNLLISPTTGYLWTLNSPIYKILPTPEIQYQRNITHQAILLCLKVYSIEVPTSTSILELLVVQSQSKNIVCQNRMLTELTTHYRILFLWSDDPLKHTEHQQKSCFFRKLLPAWWM